MDKQTRKRIVAVAALSLLAAPVGVGAQSPGVTTRASVSSAAISGDGPSTTPSASDDGRLVAFSSGADNLVPEDGNGVFDVFVRDRLAQTTERVSVASDGSEANGGSFEPKISANGRFVAFSSVASNLVSSDGNALSDVFVHDRDTGETERVSRAIDGGDPDGKSFVDSISDDGRLVGFWSFALLGAALVVAFAAWSGAGRPQLGDLLLLGAVVASSVGYITGVRVSSGPDALTPEQTISWVLVLALPATLPVLLTQWPTAPIRAASWGGFAYVALFSMWMGFFAWYRGLAWGGTLRVSQVQLLQPFVSILLSVPLLGEQLRPATLGFSIAVMACVTLGRRMSAGAPRSSS